ncbi:MAG TPA: hypothetical protein VK003_13480 [Oceanobacillus sp.]|nr:hypothetical protein [Oceanobacillus sp.]
MNENGQREHQTATPDPKQDPLGAFVHHQKRAFEESVKAVDALLPDGFKEHSREAGREFIKGMKVLVDATIDGLEKASKEFDKNFKRASGDSDDRPSTTGPNKVKVQVE